MFKTLLFPPKTVGFWASIAVLIIRVAFGCMLITHGWGKLANFTTIAPNFMGGALGLSLAVFAEFFCAMGIVVGLLYRLALIPLIINMFVAFFIAHKGVLVGEHNGELAFLYLAVFVSLFIIGTGKYAIDRFLVKKSEN